MSAPTWQDFYDLGLYTLQARRPRLVVRPGDVTDALLAGCATMADLTVGYGAGRFRATYLDGAERDDLTVEAADRGVTRSAGAAAIGEVTLTRPAAGVGGTVLAGFRVATAPAPDGSYAIYTTDTDAVFAAADTARTVTATASAAGRASNVAAGAVVRVLDTPFDTTLVPSNAARFVGGMEPQSDADLRDTVRSFHLTQRRGTADALITGARQIPGVVRVALARDEASLITTLYVADEDGHANGTMVAAVAAEIEHWRAFGDRVTVVGATIYLQSISVALTVRTGVAIAALLDRVRAAIVARVGRLAAGEVLYRDAVASAVREVDREAILTVSVITPAANVAPSAHEIIRTTTDLVEVS